jgi:hypothetical protein
MKRQERTARATKKAAVEAEAIIAEAVEKVKRTRKLPEEHLALAQAVKDQRDAGVAWWAIGHALGLPGSADNVAQGKGGAAYARRIYAAAFGEVPRSQVRNGMRASREKNEDVKALRKQRKSDRQESVRAGVAVLRDNMTNEEVVETLVGRTIGWHIPVHELWPGGEQHYAEQEASIHPKWAKVEEHNGERCIVFKEFDPKAPIKFRMFAGSTRIVRLSRIHTVR